MHPIALVFLGGGLGSVARYLMITGKWLPHLNSFLGTLVVNTIGSALLGFGLIFYRHYILGLAEFGMASNLWKTTEFWHRVFIPLVFVGFCGGFTTFSSYILDVYTQLLAGRFWSAGLLLAAHLVLGLAAAGLGIWLALRFTV